jgi:hypothetical protein
MDTHLEIIQYHVFVGIDWANDKHDICLQDLATNKREFSVIEHKPKILTHGLTILKNDLVLLSLLLLNSAKVRLFMPY